MEAARHSPDGTHFRQEASIWLRWVLANLVGEALGFGLGLSVGFALALPFGQPEGVVLVIAIIFEIVVVGAIEGLCVGLAQHLVLGGLIPGPERASWVRATVAGAIIAWGVGMMLGNWAGEQMMAVLGGSWLLGGLVIGVLAGSIFSAFQWRVLRRVVARAGVWVPAHVAAWAVGMLVAFAGVDTIPENASALTVVGTASVVGVGMGLTVAALTGLALLWILRGSPERRAPG